MTSESSQESADDSSTAATHDTANDQVDGSPATGRGVRRRDLLAGFLVAGGVTAAGAWFGLPKPSDDTQTESTNRETPSASEDQETVAWDQEKDVRDRFHATLLSLTPSFDYQPVSRTVDDASVPIHRISLAPTLRGDGDRAVFVAEQDRAQQIAEFTVVTWASTDESPSQRETDIDGETQQFDVYTSGEVVVATAQRTRPETTQSELFVVRGEESAIVETLVSEFDDFY